MKKSILMMTAAVMLLAAPAVANSMNVMVAQDNKQETTLKKKVDGVSSATSQEAKVKDAKGVEKVKKAPAKKKTPAPKKKASKKQTLKK